MKYSIPVILACAALVGSTEPLDAAIQIEVTYTADNVTSAFYQNGSAPNEVGLGENAAAWERADSAILDLEPNHSYSLVFRVHNTDPIPIRSNCPAAFLAQIDVLEGSIQGSIPLLTSTAWEYAVDNGEDPGDDGFDFDALAWNRVSSWGTNGSSPWSTQVAGIHPDAEWIWSEVNFPLSHSDLWVRVKIAAEAIASDVPVVPEPTALAIWGTLSGLGIALARRKKHAA